MIYKISIKDLVGTSALCKNPKIDWELPGCPDIICGKENDKTLRIEVPDHCIDRCVYVIVDCSDECGICEPQRIRVCPCDGPGDCQACEECKDNLCVSKCPEDWFCENEICVECDDNHPCPGGKVCNNGKCVCPPDKPFMDAEGNCSDCNADNPCPPCFKCTPIGCVPIECESGVCDPDTGNCEECVGKLDCGTNECCQGNKCVCCPGFILNTDGDCIPDPGCVRDSDCGECYSCDRNNGCVPTSCPPGYIRIDSEPCCVKECDCNDPTCTSTNQRCISATFSSTDPLLENKCYCAPCNGQCDTNVDCGPGCYCNGVECVPNPCFGGCITGGDCGEGCGCGPDGMCYPCGSANCLTGSCQAYDGCVCSPTDTCVATPCSGPCAGPEDCGEGCGCYDGACTDCSQIPCDQCANVPGCQCLDGISCKASPCTGPCADGNDCGPGCGCLDGDCVPCAAYSCAVNFNCPNGCNCDSNGKCQDNPCADVRCETDIDCGFGCNCDGNGYCVPCPAGNPNCGDDDCRDIKNLYSDGCKLIAEYSTDACCACEEISTGIDIASFAGGTLALSIELRRGVADDFITFGGLAPLLGADVPTSGPVRFDLVVNGITKSQNVFFTNTAGPIVVQFQNVPTDIISAQLYVRTTSGAGIALGTGCHFAIPPTQVFNVKDFIAITTKDFARELPAVPGYECRNPRFQWYKGTSPTQMTPLFLRGSEKVGVSNGKFLYRDILEQPDVPELEYGEYYAFASDCGCDKERKYYSCHGPDGPATKYRPCVFGDAPSTTVATCGVSVTFDDDLMFTCSLLDNNPPTTPLEFEIVANGQVVDTRVWNSGVAVAAGVTVMLPGNQSITSLVVRQKDTTCPCQIEIPIEVASTFTASFTPVPGSGCGAAVAMKVDVVITPSGAPQLPYTASATYNNVAIALANAGPFYGTAFQLEIPAAGSGTYVFTTTNADGCTVVSAPITYDPILTSPFTITSTCINSNSATPEIVLTITNTSPEPQGAEAFFGGTALFPFIAPNSAQTYTVAANVGNIVAHVNLIADPTCFLDQTINTQCCAEDPNWSATISLLGVNPDGTINLQVNYNNATGTVPARFFLLADGQVPTQAIADDLSNTTYTLLPGNSATATYSNLPCCANPYDAYNAHAQFTGWPQTPSCYPLLAQYQTAAAQCQQLTGMIVTQGFVGSPGFPPASVPTTGASAFTYVSCYPGGSSTPPQITFGNGATVNMDFYIDGVYMGMLTPGAVGISSNIADFGTHTFGAKITNSNCVLHTQVYTPTCLPSDPPPEDECANATDRMTLGGGDSGTSPACANQCPVGNDICVIMCCGYSGNPSAPVMLLYNNTGFPVEVRRNSNNTLLVAAGAMQTLAASAVVFPVNGTFDVKIIVDTGGSACETIQSLAWACQA